MPLSMLPHLMVRHSLAHFLSSIYCIGGEEQTQRHIDLTQTHVQPHKYLPSFRLILALLHPPASYFLKRFFGFAMLSTWFVLNATLSTLLVLKGFFCDVTLSGWCLDRRCICCCILYFRFFFALLLSQ